MQSNVSVTCAWCSAPGRGDPKKATCGICVDCAMGFLKKLPRDYLASIADPDGTVTLVSGHKLELANAG